MSKDKRNIILAFMMGILFMGGTFSFAYFLMDITGTGSDISKLSTGKLELKIKDEIVNISNLAPIYDVDYENYAYKKEFEIENNGTLNGCSDIYLDITSISESLKSKYFKYKLVSDTDTYTGDFTEVENSRLLLAKESMVERDLTKKYTLYIWLSYDENINQNELLGTTMKGKLSLESKDCKSLTYDLKTLAFYVNDNKVEELNNKMDYTLVSYTCENGQTVTYNNADKSINVKPILKKVACTLYFKASYTKEFAYKGNYEEFIVPESGYYKIELWGAQGIQTQSLGGYSSGIIYLKANEKLYFYIGERKSGMDITTFNSGTSSNGGQTGGGATDVRYFKGKNPSANELLWNSSLGVNSRIMVAGGSGSGVGNNNTTLGAGGGLIANNGGGTLGGTQITFGSGQYSSWSLSKFGVANGGCSGGNGYYPGGGAGCANGAGGGSSFISGYAGVNAIVEGSVSEPREHTNNTLHYSGKYFIDGKMEKGVNEGSGKAKITYVGNKPNRVNTKLNNVRYIKDCINGNTANAENHWVELQAIKDGVNLAKGKTVTGITNNSLYPLSRITDGDITSKNWASGNVTTGNQCIVLDLGQNYNLDEIALWRYWVDGRTYNNAITYVSSDNNTWTEVINKHEPETSEGKRVSAYSN